jgi:enamine deaminase RidA (YjgF/YER057c/UK114 family)
MGPDHQPVKSARLARTAQARNENGPGRQPRPGFANLGRALAAVGAGPGQVAKLTIHVAGHQREYLPTIDAARARPVRGPQPAETVVGGDAGPT